MRLGPDGGPSNYSTATPPASAAAAPAPAATPTPVPSGTAAPATGSAGSSSPAPSGISPEPVPMQPDAIGSPSAAPDPNDGLMSLYTNALQNPQPQVNAPDNPVTDFLKKLFAANPSPPAAPVPPGGLPPAQDGIPPQNTASGVLSNQPQINNPPSGTLFSSGSDKVGSGIFKKAQQEDAVAGTASFIDGTFGKDQQLTGSESKYYSSLSTEQRTQIAMQQLGPAGTTRYLTSLTAATALPTPRVPSYDQVPNPTASLNNFQSGFNSLVKDGKISTDDIKALAAAPGTMAESSGSDTGLNAADFSANAKLFSGLDWSNPAERSAQNYFIGSSFDSADQLRANGGKNAKNAANYLYAQGTDVLASASPKDQTDFVKNTPTARLQTVLQNSLKGESYAVNDTATDPFYIGVGTPLTGSAGLLNSIAGEGYDSSGTRLPMGTKGQTDNLMAYRTVMNYVNGTDKSGPDAQDLIASDQAGSGVRLAFSNVYQAGMPTILNDAFTNQNGGNGVATSLKQYSQFELTGQSNSPGEKAQIERNLGASLGEFEGDALALQHDPSAKTVATLDSKYGAALFETDPGTSSTAASVGDQTQNAFHLFGEMAGGVNQGLLNVQQSDATEANEATNLAKEEKKSTSDSELLYGAFIAAAGAAILTVAPEAAPALANGLITAGGLASAKGVIDSEDSPDNTPPDPYFNQQATNVGGEVTFINDIQNGTSTTGANGNVTQITQGLDNSLADATDREQYATGYSVP